MVKHSKYITDVNIIHLIKQLVRQARKTKLVLEYSFCLRRKNDEIVLIEPTKIIFNFSDHPYFNSSIFHNILEFKSLLLKNEKSKKVGRKITTGKLFKKVTKGAKMNGDLEKT